MNENLIKTLNNIQQVLAKNNLNNTLEIPQIVVIGCQSVGKSSLLEQLIGKQFLPKGEGIVTRTPILIQICNNTNLSSLVARVDSNEEEITDFEELKAIIASKTEKLAGTTKNVSKQPIVVRIEGPGVCTLNYVDLPGLTKLPINGQ